MENPTLLVFKYKTIATPFKISDLQVEQYKYGSFNIQQIVSIISISQRYYVISFSNNKYIYIDNEWYQKLIPFITILKL